MSPTARWVIRIGVVALLAWIVVSGAVLWTARNHTNDGLDSLGRARHELDDGGLLRGDATEELRSARGSFASAHDLANGIVLAPWRVIPLLGANVESGEALTAAAERVAEVAEQSASASKVLLAQHPTTGPERLEMVRRLGAITRRADRALERVPLGPDFFVVAPLGDARSRFIARYDQLRDALRSATSGADGVERMLRGPRKYLVLAANNAEMRGGSGMLLSAGTATFHDGEFSIGEMRPSSDFNLPAGAVDVPKDLSRLWGFAPIGRDWRWLGTSPRFDVTAPLAADMWEAATGERVDGVLAVDPVVVQSLLDAQGPIEVDGRRLTGDDVIQYLLLEQYGSIEPGDPEQVARRDELGTVARTAVDALSTRAWNPNRLVRRLSDAGKGRHALAWARDPVEQRAWEAAGIAGQLRFDSLAVSILNTGGNKLDPFIAVAARLEVRDRSDGGRDAEVVLRFENRAPDGLPTYVSGPHPATDLSKGEYQGLVALNTPGVASLPKLEGLPSLLVVGRDGPTKVVAAGPLRLQPGEHAEVTVRLVLPEGLDQLVVEPSARIPAISWRYRATHWQDTAEHTVDLT